jgi:hypothetical protein
MAPFSETDTDRLDWQLMQNGATGNLDALNDALRYLEVDPQSGLVFCFVRYDLLRTASPELADGVLDMIERNSRDYLLYGRRLLALLQSDDPTIQFHPLGGRSATWNRREWLNKDRV